MTDWGGAPSSRMLSSIPANPGLIAGVLRLAGNSSPTHRLLRGPGTLPSGMRIETLPITFLVSHMFASRTTGQVTDSQGLIEVGLGSWNREGAIDADNRFTGNKRGRLRRAEGKVNRKDFGMVWSKALDGGEQWSCLLGQYGTRCE